MSTHDVDRRVAEYYRQAARAFQEGRYLAASRWEALAQWEREAIRTAAS